VRLAPGVSLPPFLGVSALCMPSAKHEFVATWKGEDLDRLGLRRARGEAPAASALKLTEWFSILNSTLISAASWHTVHKAMRR
jgi:hypothetical protein